MFGIGGFEFLVILAVAVMVVGPKDMPRALYSAGKLFRKFKSFTGDIQKSLDSILREEELNEIIDEANKPGGDNLQFEIEQQAAIEERRKQAEKESQKGGTDV